MVKLIFILIKCVFKNLENIDEEEISLNYIIIKQGYRIA